MQIVFCVDEDALQRFAADFAKALKPGDCIALIGDLGAGKTTFARSVIRAAADDFSENLDVPSPTFTLVQLYETPVPIAHLDLYRISDPLELDDLGLGSALQSGAALIEWPERAEGNLPDNLITIAFEEPSDNPDARILNIEANAEFQNRLKRSQLIRDFLNTHIGLNAKRLAFSGDASARAYELIDVGESGRSLILMDAPKTPDGPPIYDGLPYSQVVHLAEEVSAFVAISELLISKGFAAPKIIAHNMPEGLLLIENLGNEKIVDGNNRPIEERYLASAEVLAQVHAVHWPQEYSLPDGSMHLIPRYDVRAMRTGLSLLPDWWGRENDLSAEVAAELYALWEPIFERFQTGYDDIIIRDYHSPNIIWSSEKEGSDRIGIIDHQDAMIGPGLYDVASLMQDARTIVSPELQEKILQTYCAARGNNPDFDEQQARLDIATLCAFRNSRLLGLWVRLDLRDNKPRFRSYVPQTKTYLAQALAHEGLEDLRHWYAKAGVIDE
ncbi:MAG: tRNA (adenosine(37)-N6)-threonylcarbamoyltransferase complex ATPase subunit type 1 TsaE [Pseudomonadota bacterium]